ncbi:MAG TPA: AmmeMemoRadiSam system protein B [Terriglobales bacterium]|nr:AmmeMemoRadiSam system protein B [Terriglobales bacterium]
MEAAVRRPAVAGRFYAGDAEALLGDVQKLVGKPKADVEALGCVVPHAGYMYSGHVAGAVYGRLKLPRKFIILCPNHTGVGRALAIMTRGAWMTPLGEAAIDEPLAAELMHEFHVLEEDGFAHLAEHSLEVQLPFLQVLAPGFTFVPICIGVGGYDVLAALGQAVARVAARAPEKVMVIASSDMNHYETDAVTRRKDQRAIGKVLALDPRALVETVQREKISMCGYGPTTAMLVAALRLGAQKAVLVKYATSADVTGDKQNVVGYAGLVVQ